MNILVTGGSASGKSSLAERLAVQGPPPWTYVATMRPWGAEARARIDRHRRLRRGRGFETLECYALNFILSLLAWDFRKPPRMNQTLRKGEL